MIAPLIYLVTYGSAFAALAYPFYGLLVYVCIGIIRPEFLGYNVVPPGNYSRVAGVALLAGWAIHGFGRRDLGRAKVITLLAVGFWLWSIVCATFSADPPTAWAAVLITTKILLPFLAGVTLLDSSIRVKLLAWVIVMSQSAIALVMTVAYFNGFNRAKDIGFSGYDNNGVALLMVTCLPIAFFLAFAEQSWWRRGVALGGATMMAHCILITGSRGGMIGTVAIIIASLLFLIPRRPIYYAAISLSVLLMIALATQETRDRFQSAFSDESQRDDSARDRLQLWHDTSDVMMNNPIVGVGPDHFPLVATQYGWPEGKAGHTHWLQTGAELGIPGLALLAAFYAMTIVRLWPVLRQGAEDGEVPWIAHGARMVIASLIGFIVAAQFLTVTGVELPYFIVLLGAGIVRVAGVSEQAKSDVTASIAPSVAVNPPFTPLPRS